MSEVKEIGAKESGDDEYGAAYHQVFLLGENRWEDSSRLAGRDKQTDGSTIGISTTKCLACRGEGHVLCTGEIYYPFDLKSSGSRFTQAPFDGRNMLLSEFLCSFWQTLCK